MSELQEKHPRGRIFYDGTRFDLQCPECGHWAEIDENIALGVTMFKHEGCWCGCVFTGQRIWISSALPELDDPRA